MSDYRDNLKQIIEAAILAADEPLSLQKLQTLFDPPFVPELDMIKTALTQLEESCADRGIELIKVASGYRFQAKAEFAPWLQKLWERKAPRYSRAVLETLALIAYRQPITRGEIEDVRGVAVSPEIIKKLMDRDWIKVVGQRDVAGKPSLFGTTKKFLDYFNLEKLSDLPTLDEIKDLEEIGDSIGMQLSLGVDFSEFPADLAETPIEPQLTDEISVVELLDAEALKEEMV